MVQKDGDFRLQEEIPVLQQLLMMVQFMLGQVMDGFIL